MASSSFMASVTTTCPPSPITAPKIYEKSSRSTKAKQKAGRMKRCIEQPVTELRQNCGQAMNAVANEMSASVPVIATKR
jgi:hypothetical protein